MTKSLEILILLNGRDIKKCLKFLSSIKHKVGKERKFILQFNSAQFVQIYKKFIASQRCKLQCQKNSHFAPFLPTPYSTAISNQNQMFTTLPTTSPHATPKNQTRHPLFPKNCKHELLKVRRARSPSTPLLSLPARAAHVSLENARGMPPPHARHTSGLCSTVIARALPRNEACGDARGAALSAQIPLSGFPGGYLSPAGAPTWAFSPPYLAEKVR